MFDLIMTIRSLVGSDVHIMTPKLKPINLTLSHHIFHLIMTIVSLLGGNVFIPIPTLKPITLSYIVEINFLQNPHLK